MPILKKEVNHVSNLQKEEVILKMNWSYTSYHLGLENILWLMNGPKKQN